MGNPFAITSNTNMWPPVQKVEVGSRGTQGAGGAGGTRAAGAAGGSTPFQNDWDDFKNSIAGWGGTPNLNMPGDPKFNAYF